MGPGYALVLVGVFLAWAAACYHVVAAYRRSPEASAFEPFWRSAFSPAGRRHLRLFGVWASLALVLLVGLLLYLP